MNQKNIKDLQVYIGEFITNKEIRKKQKQLKILKELELNLLNECSDLIEEYKNNVDVNVRSFWLK